MYQSVGRPGNLASHPQIVSTGTKPAAHKRHQKTGVAGKFQPPAFGQKTLQTDGSKKDLKQRAALEAHGINAWINSTLLVAADTGGNEQLLATVAAFLPQMNLVNMSTSMHRLARLNACIQNAESLMEHPTVIQLCSAILQTLRVTPVSTSLPQSLSNIMCSMASLHMAGKDIVEVAADLAMQSISLFKPAELSSFVWAVAKVGVEGQTVKCFF